MARHFVLNTGAKIPSVGLGTWQSDPGVVGNAVYAAVKVRTNTRPRPVFFSLR
jgi:alcohol dehydrogenase (NADP+)